MLEYCEIEGKIVFKTKQQAFKMAQRVSKCRGGNMTVYKCPHCGLYHTTSQHNKYKKKRTLHRKGE